MLDKNQIFISWSKKQSEFIAEELMTFLVKVFNNNLPIFISSKIEKGYIVDGEIHNKLLSSKICLVCITTESLKSPWLMYEAGVVSGSGGIVIPILFEEISDWNSWIDKPLVRYVPVKYYNNAKNDFLQLVHKIENEFKAKAFNFDEEWNLFFEKINCVLIQNQTIPNECKLLIEKLKMQNDNYFTPDSPEVKNGQITFYRGFHSDPLYKILTDNIKDEGGKYFWYYGRKGSKILKRQYLSFYKYLSEAEKLGGMGVDFRCLLVKPYSIGAQKADRGQPTKFNLGLQESIEYALSLKNIGVSPNLYFRLYKNVRENLIVRSDNSVLTSGPVYGPNGTLNYFTENPFCVYSALKKQNETDNRGYCLIKEFEKVWEKAEPLTEELFYTMYKEKLFYP